MLNTKEKEQILNAYHKTPDVMERLVDSLLILQNRGDQKIIKKLFEGVEQNAG
ncbi:MAG: hypothetical protein IJM98_08960 [Oscillospiraceae bacterium]|nr:hypothetical protein [Oscillospiraceae bacterium]